MKAAAPPATQLWAPFTAPAAAGRVVQTDPSPVDAAQHQLNLFLEEEPEAAVAAVPHVSFIVGQKWKPNF